MLVCNVVRFRCWQDMMHGTLEVKQDGLTADAIHRPEWMDEVAAVDMTDERRKVWLSAHFSRCFLALFRTCHLNTCRL